MILIVPDKDESTSTAPQPVNIIEQDVAELVEREHNHNHSESAVEDMPAERQSNQHKHNHPAPAVEDMLEERQLNEKIMLQPADGELVKSNSHLGTVLAIAVALVAVALYTYGLFSSHDIKDGGAVLVS